MVFYPKYPEEVFKFIKESDLNGRNLQAEIKEKFGFDIPKNSIYNLVRHHRLGRPYVHGHATVSWLTKPIGSERFDKDGYVRVMTENGEKLKHRLVWEKANGKIEPDEVIFFMDGDKTNCELSNLRKIKRKYLTAIGNYLRGVKRTPEIVETALNAAFLIIIAKEKEIEMRKGKKGAKPKKDNWVDIVQLHWQGKTANEIAKEIGCGIGRVGWVVRREKMGYYDDFLEEYGLSMPHKKELSTGKKAKNKAS